MGKSVTLKDIADKIGVSVVTVSKALAGKEGVSEELREKIKELASEMGYRALSSMKDTNKSGNIGVLIHKKYLSDNINAFYLKIYQSLVQALARRGYYAIMEVITFDIEAALDKPSLLENNKVDGLIILGQLASEYMEMMNNTGVDMVLLDFYDKRLDMDAVIPDSVYGSYKATNYLISQGHYKIGFVGSLFATNSIMDRYLGVMKALIENGYTMKKYWLIEDRNKKEEFIPFELPEKDKMPTAFVCNCDEVCYNFVKALKAKGYRVPEDVSVVGFDDHVFATLSSPQLTTVGTNMDSITETVVDTIIKKVNNERYSGGLIIIESKLIIRDSVYNRRRNGY